MIGYPHCVIQTIFNIMQSRELEATSVQEQLSEILYALQGLKDSKFGNTISLTTNNPIIEGIAQTVNHLSEKFQKIPKKDAKGISIKETNINSSDLDTIKGYIQLAVDFDVNVKFNYHKSQQFEGGVQSLRTIKPKGFKVIGQHNSICVFGYCYMREEERTFNIERISDLKINPNEIEFWSN